jgi:hypothetical protein
MIRIRDSITFEYLDAEPWWMKPTRWQRFVARLHGWLFPSPPIRAREEAQRIADACIADLADAPPPEQERLPPREDQP